MIKAASSSTTTKGNESGWYFCPYCHKRLFKGVIRTLKMICPNCNRLIDSDGETLLNNQSRETAQENKKGKPAAGLAGTGCPGENRLHI